MSIFVVTGGEYSDYKVIAAYSTLAAAEEALALGLGDSIKEVPLDAIPEKPPGLFAFRGFISRDGKVNVQRVDPFSVVDGKLTSRNWKTLDVQIKTEVARNELAGGRLLLHFTCWAADEQHAAKIANEQRAKLIALGQWPT